LALASLLVDSAASTVLAESQNRTITRASVVWRTVPPGMFEGLGGESRRDVVALMHDLRKARWEVGALCGDLHHPCNAFPQLKSRMGLRGVGINGDYVWSPSMTLAQWRLTMPSRIKVTVVPARFFDSASPVMLGRDEVRAIGSGPRGPTRRA
jgi:hypothetical protein